MDFDIIYTDYFKRIYNYLLRLACDKSIAEDLTQETFIKANNGLSSFRKESKVSTWLYRIATNVHTDYCRRADIKAVKTTRPLDEKISEAKSLFNESVSFEQSFERSEMSSCVQYYISHLPTNYKTVLILYEMEGMKMREIAGVLGCTQQAAKVRLHRARKKLRHILNAECKFSYDERNVFVCEPSSNRKQP